MYHITHRGNRRQPVFFDDADREYYRHWLRRDATKWGLDIWAYCLMTNHIHLVVTANSSYSLRKVLGRAQSRHARWVNRRRGWSGHLWEDRFHSSLLDEAHFHNAVQYVELNPVRAGIVARAESYQWSSARSHCLGVDDPLLSGVIAPQPGWSAWLEKGLPAADIEQLRLNTSTGRPTAAPEFVKDLEARLRRKLSLTRSPVNPVGRPLDPVENNSDRHCLEVVGG